MFSIQYRIMRKLLYTLALVALACSCQREELVPETHGNGISTGEATISFSALMPTPPASTKTLGGNPVEGVNNLYLIVFDENGMLVETREATLGDAVSHDPHASEQKYSVTLTLTEKPRIIHFVANCPVDQVIYGHEASVVGNMYVENGDIAYWARIEVDEIVIEADADGNPVTDANGNPLLTEMDKFKCVPMLRNYAQLTVANIAGNFVFEGFLIYNVTHRGTVAPYNSYSNPVGFQSFINPDDNETYNYPELYDLPYYGHSLTSTILDVELPTENNDGVTYIWNVPQTVNDETVAGPVYMYERKVSVKQGNEADWRESPSHLIIKGKYDSDEESSYYKVDLTRKIDGIPQYYNILRNFFYHFTIHEIHSSGYKTVAEAVAGSTSNNLSGSAATSRFDNISDQVGRLWVSYTAKTLVEGGDGVTLEFYYKYVPDLTSINTVAHEELSGSNITGVKFENMTGGNVIESYEISDSDETNGTWAGYRKVTMTIKEPKDLAEEQIFTIKAVNGENNNAEILSRDIQLILKTPYNMVVSCTEKVAASIGEKVVVDILIPDDLTQNLFPLDLNIEAEKRSLSPDLSENTLPVVSGNSVIPGKEDVASFYYVKTIETKDEYDNLEEITIDGKNYKVVKTYWITNRADNASKVYVQNEYFNTAYDNFINPLSFNGEFSKSSLGADDIETVDYSFDIHEYVEGMTVTVTLDRLAPIASGSGLTATSIDGVYTFTPTAAGRQTVYLQTTETAEGTCSVTIDTDESYGYMAETDEIQQVDAIIFSGTNKTVTLSVSRPNLSGGGNNSTWSYSATINSITVDGATVDYAGNASYTYNRTGTLTITLDSITITGKNITLQSEVVISYSVTFTRGTNSQTTTDTTTQTIDDLGLTQQ